MAEETAFENGWICNFEELLTFNLDLGSGHTVCTTHRPRPIYQISFKLKKPFVDGRTYARTYGRMDI